MARQAVEQPGVAPGGEAPVLAIEGIVKSFGDRRALDGVSFAMSRGEVVGLLGPNGAGKSTLVRTIMGRVVPDAGRVLVFGCDAEAPGARDVVGFVPQEIALYPLLTAEENLSVFGRYLGLSGKELAKAAEEALTWAGLSDRRRDVVKTFSGGMKRRLNLAAGVLHEPKLILLDEPTVGVDPQSRERMYEMIEELRARGASLVYTTHYMEEAERLCERIAIIDHGRVIAVGTRDELVRQAIGGGRELLLRVDGEVPEDVAAILRARGAAVDGAAIAFGVADGVGAMADLLRLVGANRLSVVDVSMKQPTLESVFLHLTGRELRE